MLEYQIEPLLEQGRGGIPIERMLKQNDVVLAQQILLETDIHLEIRIGLVKVVNPDAFKAGHRARESAVGHRCLERRMRKQDQDLVRHSYRVSGLAFMEAPRRCDATGH